MKSFIRVIFGIVISLNSFSMVSANELSLLGVSAFPTSIISSALRMDEIKAFDESQRKVDSLCRKIAGRLGSVKLSDCLNRGMESTGGYSVDGLPIMVKEYGPKGGVEPMAKVLLVGGIHGDELSSVSLVFKWMNILDQLHSGLVHWRMVPAMNPDGVLQRKAQRTNRNGVDLNRNFPTPNWEAESQKYWAKTSKNPRRYPGHEALSEPEAQWLSDYISDFKPDVIVSIHAPFGLLDFDGPRKAPKSFGPLELNLLGIYPGSLGNYAGVQRQIPVVTIELESAGIMPKARDVTLILRDLVEWLEINIAEPKRLAEQETALAVAKAIPNRILNNETISKLNAIADQ